MKKYEHYKNSGVEWLGEIPEHWEAKKLKFLGNAIIGLTYNPNDLCDENIGTLVLRSSNIFEGKLKYGEKENVYVKSKIPEKLKIRPEDIIICSRNGSRDLIGKCAIATKNDIGHSFGAFTTVFRSDINHFIYYFLNSSIFKSLSGVFLTSTINQLTIGNLNSIDLAVPPKEEQTAIAHFLDDKTTKIDQAIAIKQKQIELLKERRQILIHKAVTRGLNDNVKLKDSGVAWIGEIPEHWEVKALKYICNLQSGEFISSEDFKEEGYPIYGGNGFRGFSEKYTNDGHFVLIGRQGALCGNVNYTEGKFYATEHAVVVYPLNSENVLWLGESIKVANFNRLSQSAAQPGIAVGVIKNERFPYPPKEEQTEIAEFIETATTKIATAISLKEQEIEKLKEYKMSLIDGVVTGKVKVS